MPCAGRMRARSVAQRDLTSPANGQGHHGQMIRTNPAWGRWRTIVDARKDGTLTTPCRGVSNGQPRCGDMQASDRALVTEDS